MTVISPSNPPTITCNRTSGNDDREVHFVAPADNPGPILVRFRSPWDRFRFEIRADDGTFDPAPATILLKPDVTKVLRVLPDPPRNSGVGGPLPPQGIAPPETSIALRTTPPELGDDPNDPDMITEC